MAHCRHRCLRPAFTLIARGGHCRDETDIVGVCAENGALGRARPSAAALSGTTLPRGTPGAHQPSLPEVGARGGGDRSPTSGRRGWCAPGVPRGRVVPDSAAAVGPAQPTVLSADANYVGFVATMTPAGD